MINWIFVKYLRDEDHAVSPVQKSAQAFLSSMIADGDVITDWLYYFEIQNNQDVQKWLKYLQLVSCITGTFSWLSLATDGRFLNLFRSSIIWIIYYAVKIVVHLPLQGLLNIMGRCDCDGNTSYDRIEDIFKWIKWNFLKPLKKKTKRKSAFSSGSLLILGIILEDIPQLVITFFIEEKINSNHPRGDISSTAVVNLNFAIFDICHKIAQAIDLRFDILNPAYYVIRTIQAHANRSRICSLVVAGVNQVLSSSRDGTAKLWDSTSGKCIKVFDCDSRVYDAVVMDNSKVITACHGDKCLCIFNMTTGKREMKLELGYYPYFVSLTPNGRSIFTGGRDGHIQRWDGLLSEECSFTYKLKATSLSFLDNETFVSIRRDKNIRLGNINNRQQIKKIKLENETRSVLAMSPTTFLIGDWIGKVHQFVHSENEWKFNSKVNVSDKAVRSLTKVNESLFVASDRTNAKLYNLTNISSPLFVFKGHGSSIWSSVFLKGLKAVATGNKNGYIKIWSIENYLEEDAQNIPQQIMNNDEHDDDPTINAANKPQNTINNNTSLFDHLPLKIVNSQLRKSVVMTDMSQTNNNNYEHDKDPTIDVEEP